MSAFYSLTMNASAGAGDAPSEVVPSRLRRTAIQFIAGFAMLIALGVAAVFASLSTQRSFDWVNQSYEVMHDARGLIRAVIDAEGEQRGFLITGDESFVVPYEEAERQASAEMAALAAKAAQSPRQREAIAALQPAVEEILSQLRGKFEVRRVQGFDAARAAVLTQRAEESIGRLREQVDQFVSSEAALLANRQAVFVRRSHVTTIAVSLALIVTALLLGFEVRVLHRRTQELEAIVKICAWTKRVKHRGGWMTIEQYLFDRFGLHLSHGISDEARRSLELEEFEAAEKNQPN